MVDFWQGSPATSATAPITDTSQPQWLQDYSRALMGTAVNAASQPPADYTAPRLAGIDPLSTQAQALGQQNVGSWKPGTAYAGQITPTMIQPYMNPYQDQVVNRIAQLGQRNLTENLLPQINSTFTGAGQFGSTRNQDFTNRALRDVNESALGQQGQLLNTGYQQAMQNAAADAARIGNVAAQGAQLGAADVASLDVMGRGNQALEQQNLDLNYQNFLQQQQQPKQDISWLSDIIRGMPAQQYSTPLNMGIPAQGAVMSPLLQAAQTFAGTKSLLAPTQQVQQQTVKG